MRRASFRLPVYVRPSTRGVSRSAATEHCCMSISLRERARVVTPSILDPISTPLPFGERRNHKKQQNRLETLTPRTTPSKKNPANCYCRESLLKKTEIQNSATAVYSSAESVLRKLRGHRCRRNLAITYIIRKFISTLKEQHLHG